MLAKIAEMADPDKRMALRLHEIIKVNAPTLWPKTWYGTPAYALGGKVVCFFQSAKRFDSRYATDGAPAARSPLPWTTAAAGGPSCLSASS